MAERGNQRDLDEILGPAFLAIIYWVFLILITNEISHRNKPQQKNFLFSISRFPQLLWKVYNTICSVLTHTQQNSAHQ